jgi:hypothetical protein
MFKEFLKSQHCLENLNFWIDVEKYKETTGDARECEARRIYESYISIMSPTEVRTILLHLIKKTKIHEEQDVNLC